MIHKDQLTELHTYGSETQEPCKSSEGQSTGHTPLGKTADCIGSSLPLPKSYLATSTEDDRICWTVTTPGEKYTHLLVYHHD